MTTKAIVAYAVALLIMLSTVPVSAAESELPEPIVAELTLFPDATVIKGQSTPNGSHMANVNFGKASTSEVFEYYKARLMENGFTIQYEQQDQAIIASKPDMEAVINLETGKEETVGMIILDIKQSRPASPAPEPTENQPAASQTAKPDDKMDMAGLLGGETEYPEELSAIIAPYPESMIMLSRQSSQGMSVMLSANNQPAADAVAFYKSGVSEKGWQKEFDSTEGGNTVLGFTKDNQELTVTIRDAGESLIITISLIP